MIPTYSRLKKKYMEEKIMNSMKESLLLFSGANVPIDEVAKIMKKDQQFIKIGLQEKWLPIGIAYQMNDTQEFSYYISPKKLYEYTGYIYQDQSLVKNHLQAKYKIYE